MKQHVFGIDLGTAFSSVSVVNSGNPKILTDKFNEKRIPSVVSFQHKKILYGKFAIMEKIRYPEVTIYDTKRMLGKKYDDPIIQKLMKGWPFEIEKNKNGYFSILLKSLNKRYEPFEISGELLKYLALIGNQRFPISEQIKKAVITVPANFGNEQRIQTKKAAEYAGLEVVSLLNEPTAACIAYFTLKKNLDPKGENVLIFDFGAGKLDVSLIFVSNEEITVKASDGDMNLGGRDFDECTLNYFINKLKLKLNNMKKNELREVIIEAKHSLSILNTTYLNLDFLDDDEIELTLDEFE